MNTDNRKTQRHFTLTVINQPNDTNTVKIATTKPILIARSWQREKEGMGVRFLGAKLLAERCSYRLQPDTSLPEDRLDLFHIYYRNSVSTLHASAQLFLVC